MPSSIKEINIVVENVAAKKVFSKNSSIEIKKYLLNNFKLTIINSTHDPENFENVDNHLKIEIVDEQRKLFIN